MCAIHLHLNISISFLLEIFTMHYNTQVEVYHLNDPMLKIIWVLLKSKDIMVQKNRSSKENHTETIFAYFCESEKSNMSKQKHVCLRLVVTTTL